MMTTQEATVIYHTRIGELTNIRNALKKKKDRIAWSRFFILISAIIAFFYLRSYDLLVAVTISVLLIAIFLRLVALSSRNNEAIINTDQLLQVNKQEIEILSGNFLSQPEGLQFQPATHAYATDLDIFGRASLFQYINRTSSEQGSRKLADWLLAPAEVRQIIERQETAKELSGQYAWRQQLQAYGNLNRITEKTEQKIKIWMEQPDSFGQPHWKWIRFLFPAIIWVSLVFYIIDLMSAGWFYFLVFIFFIIASLISRQATPVYFHLDKIVKEISSLSNGLSWIEKHEFQARFLQQVQAGLKEDVLQASISVRQLKEILDRFDYRLNPLVFVPLNTFLFWDLQQVLSLEKWKSANHRRVHKWFEAVANMEAVASLAAISFNHPDWQFPTITNSKGSFDARNLGHPLIPVDKRVCSSFSTYDTGKIALITGSNMAGKSTFLRSVGVNIVLAMMGAPVCADSLQLSSVKVMSSMRVTDNLEESTSTFYAELKKLKQIIEAVNMREPVFLLLDEILRGTNSLDRHTGSKALIRQLLQHDAVGMIATHDLELAKLGEDFPGKIHNYHFDVQVAGEELYFDYKLKEGICESMNASILMKKIGIEL